MRLSIWRKDVAGERVERRSGRDFLSLRDGLLGGLLGGGSEAPSSTASAAATPDGGLLGGILGSGDAPAATLAATPVPTSSVPSTDSGLLGGVGSVASGLLSPVLGGDSGSPSADGGALLGVQVGPTSDPLLSVGIAPTSGPLIGVGVGPTSAPLLSVGIDPTGTPLGVGSGPATAPLISVGVNPLGGSSEPLLGAGSGPTSAPVLSLGVGANPPTATSTAAPPPPVSSTIPPSTAIQASPLSIASHPPSSLTSLTQTQPSTTLQTTLLTSFTAAPDSEPSSSGVGLPGTGGNTGTNTGTNSGTVDNGGGTGANGVATTSSKHSNTTTIIGISVAVGAAVLFVVCLFFIRRFFRNHRLGKAEYPPPSPLLPSMEDTLLPPGIVRSISQRSKLSHSSNNSEDWRSDVDVDGEKMEMGLGGGEGRYANTFVWRDVATRNGGLGQGYRDVGDVSPLSPLPPVKMRGGGGDEGNGGAGSDVFVDGMVFNLMPKSSMKSPAKKVELQGEAVEEEKGKIFELSV